MTMREWVEQFAAVRRSREAAAQAEREAALGIRPMTERGWLTATDPVAMLDFLHDKASARKLRLFAVAYCRLSWNLLTDERSRMAVEVAERYADDLAGEPALAAARMVAELAHREALDGWTHRLALHATEPDALAGVRSCVFWRGPQKSLRAALADLLREFFGNPFRPAAFDPGWRAPYLLALAETLYDHRAFDRLPELADALEEAGCSNADLLAHCRSAGEHLRGCWAVDALLGKE